MVRKFVALCALVLLIGGPPAAVQGQDGRTVVTAAARAMGAENLRSVQITGSGSNSGIGQNLNPGQAWPMVRVKSYTRQIDLEQLTSNAQLVRIQNNAEQTQNQTIQPNAAWTQQFDILVNPYAFLKAASAANVTTRSESVNGIAYSVVSFTHQNRYKVEGYINAQNMVERVRTWVDNDVLGDMLVEGVYTDYKDFNGLKGPSFVTVKQGGFPTLILGVTDIRPNVAVTIPPPQAPPAAQPVAIQTENIAPGVWYIRGGSHHSVLVEFADHVAVIEAPQNEARSLAVIAEVNKLVPRKPIRYLINTHHHFDHSGGLRTFVDAGATIVTHDVNKAFYEKAFSSPRSLNPDKLEQSKKKPVVEVTGDKRVMSDATRTIELHLIKNNTHNDGILMAFLPAEKILVQVDMYNPATAVAPTAPVPPNAAALLTNLEGLRLDFETILPLHGPGKATRADLYAYTRKALVPVSSLPDPNAAGRGRGRGNAAANPADAPALALLNGTCVSCHNLDRVENKQLSRDAWLDIVTRMRGRGASMTPEQIPVLTDYLAKTYGTN